MPDGEFARRMGMSFMKRCLFSLAGAKMGRMAVRRGQHYHFIFVHEDARVCKKPPTCLPPAV